MACHLNLSGEMMYVNFQDEYALPLGHILLAAVLMIRSPQQMSKFYRSGYTKNECGRLYELCDMPY